MAGMLLSELDFDVLVSGSREQKSQVHALYNGDPVRPENPELLQVAEGKLGANVWLV